MIHLEKMYDTKLDRHHDGLKFYECRGDLCFLTNDEDAACIIKEWSWTDDKHHAPRSIDDVTSQSFNDLILQLENVARLNLVARSASPAEMDEENVILPTEDHWIENEHYWIRQHVQPRRKLYIPNDGDNGPDQSTLTGRRLTKVSYDDETTCRLEDYWHGGKEAEKSLVKDWTGQTFLEKKSAGDVYADQQTMEEML